ncbi:MAG TPA: DUF6600 domain-containing protein, partial [Candidatus Limnocylindrales bacterium]|nr:DUF6600 domain-containing protein [Candidatus Limnocylindrales bacterium]
SDPLEVAVFKGEVAVRDTGYGKDIAVKKNETFTLDVLDSGRYDLEKEASADELDRWSDQRDHDLSSYASAQNYTQSPYQYGVGDLGYYGQFYDIAGYGNLWQPYGIYPGWDPFMNGYWNYSPGFGYCWVSAYPWGWMPYRYGHWVFINGRGWFWQPGAWSGWARAPRFVNPPHGFQAPAPPPLRAGTGIAPGRQPGISIVGGRPSQPGRVRIDQDEPSVRMPGHPGEGMGTRPAIETRHQAPPPATSIQEPAAPAGEPAHHESAPAPRVEREQPHPLPHVEREPARPIAPPPASVPHSEPAPHVAPPAPSVPHSAPAPHISAAPHVSAPVHK